ncbi:MAG: GNAT family N-acetyltransferase [Clostridia bacterium]|jgi:RimJ/RimL family protein N-acetyltransferase
MDSLEIVKLDRKYCDVLAKILSTDASLHKFLSPNQVMSEMFGEDYYNSCLNWETKKNGQNFCILFNKVPIGSISYAHKDTETASVGMWISSGYWNTGLGTQILKIFMEVVRSNGYSYLTGSIQKWNPRSKRMCEKCGATFKEDENKWYPTFIL